MIEQTVGNCVDPPRLAQDRAWRERHKRET
jgi:hypothetical protein